MKIKKILLGLNLAALALFPLSAKAMTFESESRIDVNVEKVTPMGWIIEGEWTACKDVSAIQYSTVKECTIKGKLLKSVTDNNGKAWTKGTAVELSFRFSSLPMARSVVPQVGEKGIFMLRQAHPKTGMTSLLPGSTIQFQQSGGKTLAIGLPSDSAMQFKDATVLQNPEKQKAISTNTAEVEKVSKALQSFRNYSQQMQAGTTNTTGTIPRTPLGIPAEDASVIVQSYSTLIYGK